MRVPELQVEHVSLCAIMDFIRAMEKWELEEMKESIETVDRYTVEYWASLGHPPSCITASSPQHACMGVGLTSALRLKTVGLT